MLGTLSAMAKVDDLLMLKRAAEGLRNVLDHRGDKDAIADAIAEVEADLAALINRLVPDSRPVPAGHAQVLLPIIQKLPSQINGMKARVMGSNSGPRSTFANGGLMSIAGTGIYVLVRVFLDSTKREDCKLR